jgi:chemotaxis response regulator CheB
MSALHAVSSLLTQRVCSGSLKALEEEMKIAEQNMFRAQQEMLSTTKATKPAKVARTAAPKAPAKPRTIMTATSTDGAPAPKRREPRRLPMASYSFQMG